MMQEDGWAPIEMAPNMTWIQMYSPDYHKGPGMEKNGIMQGRVYQEDKNAPMQFFDDFGIAVGWKFTHWKEISKPPGDLLANFKENKVYDDLQ